MKLIKKVIITGTCLTVLLLTGCTGSSSVQYTDPTAVDTISTNFSSTDLQMITSSMVDSLLTSPLISNAYQKNGGPLIIFVDNLQNNTDQHIDSGMITDAITSKILGSGTFQLVDMKAMNSAKKQLDFQHYSGMVDQNKAMKMGTMTGAQYMLYGNIGTINAQNSDQKSVFYQITLSVMDLKSGLVTWQNTKQIRKTQKRASVGW